MKRLALALTIAVAALVALGSTLGGDLAGVEPATGAPPPGGAVIDSGSLTPPGCAALTPSQAESPATACRDYLYQVHCQFDDSVGDDEDWDEWCLERRSLNESPPFEVPDCDVDLAGEATEIGRRCRDYLVTTRCFGVGTSEHDMKEFCEAAEPNAGPNPVPRTCDTGLASEHSVDGNQCWEQLKQKYCSGWKEGDNTGAEDLNQFCNKVASGALPPVVNPSCDQALAKQDSPAGLACREQLFTSECALRSTPPPSAAAFCREVAKELAEEEKARKDQAAKEHPSGPVGSGDSGDSKDKKKPRKKGSPNVVLQLGREPACDRESEFNEELKRACAVTGSVMHTYPFANYGIDNNVSIDVLEDDFWTGETPIMSLFQWLIVGVWQALLWLVKVALLVVQWAFGVDPLSRSGGGVKSAVMSVFNLVGPGWRLTAFAILGVWVLWTAIVRLRFVQGLTGVLASVLLMSLAMWITYHPEDTIGKVAKYANESSLVVLSATSSGELEHPGRGLAASQRTVFEQLIVGGWCALQFGGQRACAEKTGDDSITNADLWLSLPANSSARGLLYKATVEGPDAIAGEKDANVIGDFFDSLGDKLCPFTLGATCKGLNDAIYSKTEEEHQLHPEQVQQFEDAKARAMSLIKQNPGMVKMQGSEGVFTRAGLLVVIAIGIIGAVAFLLSIGVRLLTAGVMLLLLILMAPVMFVVAAFGEEGRRRFVTWLRMLFGAAAAKLIYALILGLALLVVSILNEIPLTPAGLIFPEPAMAAEPDSSVGASGDWLGNWVLVSAFFWVALLKLDSLLELFSPDPHSERSNGLGAGAALWMGQRMVSQAMRGAWQSATFLPRNAPRAARAARRELGTRRQATDGAIRAQADDRLRERTKAASRAEFAEAGKRAQQTLGENRSQNPRRRMALIDRALQRNPTGQSRERLEGQRQKAERDFMRHEASERAARSELYRQAQGYSEPNEGEHREGRAQRRRDVAEWEKDKNGDSWSSDNNLRWAGITSDEWRLASRDVANGSDERMQLLRQRSEQALERDRRLLSWRDNRRPMTPQARREALSEWGRGTFDENGRFSGYGRNPELADRQRNERRAIRRERRLGRDNLWPPNR